jgi:hypothetical protein
MKKTSLILIKTSSKYAYDNGINNVLVPKFEKGKEILNKISGEVKAQISQPRNLLHHSKLFAISNDCCKNNIFEKLIQRWELARQVFNIQLDISELAIQAIRIRFKQDSYSLIYICKWLFLPLEEELKPDGSISYKISSIAFSEMDEIIFTDFYNKCLNFLVFILDVNRNDIE